MINAFANGELDKVMGFYYQHGSEVFDFVPRIKGGHFDRLIYYAFKNCHYNVINFYLSILPEAKITDDDVRALAKGIAHRDKFAGWFNESIDCLQVDTNKLLKSKIKPDVIFNYISSYVIRTYDIDLIDQFLDKFPDKFESILSQCAKSASGVQLRRHLQLKQLV